jgi:hypothetical protein|eukprot:COSAG01_NODE_3591_length_5899_cov_68.196034_4_plen_130_part_00
MLACRGCACAWWAGWQAIALAAGLGVRQAQAQRAERASKAQASTLGPGPSTLLTGTRTSSHRIRCASGREVKVAGLDIRLQESTNLMRALGARSCTAGPELMAAGKLQLDKRVAVRLPIPTASPNAWRE